MVARWGLSAALVRREVGQRGRRGRARAFLDRALVEEIPRMLLQMRWEQGK